MHALFYSNEENLDAQSSHADVKETKMLYALEWLAAMCTHVPNKDEQMVRYYGYYDNAARGKRKKADADNKMPCIVEPEFTDMAFRKKCG